MEEKTILDEANYCKKRGRRSQNFSPFRAQMPGAILATYPWSRIGLASWAFPKGREQESIAL